MSGLRRQIFPAHTRGLASSVATLVNWTCSYCVTQSFKVRLSSTAPTPRCRRNRVAHGLISGATAAAATTTTQGMLHMLTPGGAFLVYALELIVAWYFIRAVVPETKGRSLEQLEAYFKSQAS